MIKAKGSFRGKETFIIGLSWGNLDMFRAGAGDSYIKIDGAEHGLPVDILIISDKTEADMTRLLEGGFTSETEFKVSKRLKN